MSLGPLQLAGLTLHLEVLVAFGPTEAELSGIVADECDSLTRECRAGTEVTGFNTVDKKYISIVDSILIIINGQNLPHGCRVVLVMSSLSRKKLFLKLEWWSKTR